MHGHGHVTPGGALPLWEMLSEFNGIQTSVFRHSHWIPEQWFSWFPSVELLRGVPMRFIFVPHSSGTEGKEEAPALLGDSVKSNVDVTSDVGRDEVVCFF